MVQLLLRNTLLLLFVIGALSAPVTWNEIPEIRTGTIEPVTTLMTSEDISPNVTDKTSDFITSMSVAAITSDLKYGLSLMSYQSWMTDTFSFNISMLSYDYQRVTIRFQVIDNTFFSKAKVHYIIVWRANSLQNNPLSPGTQLFNMDVIHGCYLTSSLIAGTGTRNQTVGNVSTDIPSASSVVIKSMISGMQLNNTVGKNNYIKVLTQYSATPFLIEHFIQVQNNNLLTFVCLTTIIYDPTKANSQYYDIVQYQTIMLNATNAGLTTVTYMERFDGLSRLFFGISQFNLSMSDTRQLNVETANISLVSQIYIINSALNKIMYNLFFFVNRACPNASSDLYDPITFSCVSVCPPTSQTVPASKVCIPCHYSCITCTAGNLNSACSGNCNSVDFRVNVSSGGFCSCIAGYVDVGVSLCQPCTQTLVGCSICTSPTYCTACFNSTSFLNATTYVLNTSLHICQCAPNYYMASSYCLSYPGCLQVRYFLNNIVCDVCDASKNYNLTTSNNCSCYQGFIQNITTLKCEDHCNDSIAAYGKCDDGNLSPGDGCDQFCNVQNGYYCPFNYTSPGVPGRSYCVLKQDITIKYLYAERQINTNKFKMAFSMTPAQSGMNANSFANNLQTSLPIASQKIYFDPDSSTIFIQGEFTESIEGTKQTVTVTFNGNSFYADLRKIEFTAVGVNAQLNLENYATPNNILKYIVMMISFLAVISAIFAAVVGLKMVGIQLLIPVQLIYFSLATINYHTTYSFILSDLKYSNGYNSLIPYNYFRTYSQSKNLIGINYQTQFLLSTNVMLVVFVLILLWLLIHHFRLKYKQYKLEKFLQTNAPIKQNQQNNSQQSEEDKEDQQQDQQKVKLSKKKNKNSAANNEMQQQQYKLRQDHHRSFKVFTFEVDRIYFIFYLILMNQMMFGFIIMTLNVPIATFYFPQQINVLICNFLFFIFVGNIVFISYDQQSNKMIAFTCIKDRYAYVYLLINFIIIVVLSMTFQESFSTYLICVLSVSFLALVIKERPYSSVFLSFQNMVAAYLQFMLVICLVLLCIIRTSPNAQQKTLLIYSYLIVAFIFIGQILTIIRIAAKVNFKKAFDDLKNPNSDDDLDKKKKKIIQRKFDKSDLIDEDKNIQILPPESFRNGILTPKDRIHDWGSKNTEQYQSMKERQHENNSNNEEPQQNEHEDQMSENKQEKLNDLEVLKKKLRNNLKQKKEADMSTKKGN